MATARHDLREFFRAVGRFRGQRALGAAPEERPTTDVPVELLDDRPAPVRTDPLEVAAFVDGIQASLIVTHRAHRPVYLFYVAAGALGPGARPVGLDERLSIVCAHADRDWVDALGSTIPVVELAAEEPPDIERAAYALLDSTRDGLERQLVSRLLHDDAGTLVVDGSLIGRPPDRRLVGVVKSTKRQYLADEGVLFGLPEGWRSPRFRIPASGAQNSDRFSCYLRLHDASHDRWNYALIRLEAFDAALLDALAARCLLERQGAGSGDPRWERHLASVHATEEFLRARRPPVFAGIT